MISFVCSLLAINMVGI